MPSWFWLALIVIFVLFAIFCFCMAGMASHLANKIEEANEEIKRNGE